MGKGIHWEILLDRINVQFSLLEKSKTINSYKKHRARVFVSVIVFKSQFEYSGNTHAVWLGDGKIEPPERS